MVVTFRPAPPYKLLEGQRPVFLLRTTPSPLCWAPGQMLDWQAVAMGTSQGHWCRDISSSHLFRVIDTPGPSTLHLLTEGLAGALQGGVCVWVIGLNPDHIRSLLSAFTSRWSEPQKPPSSNSWGCPSSLSLPCGPSVKVAAHPFGSPWLLE